MSIFKFFRYGVAILSSFLGGVFVAFSQSAVPTPQDCLGAIPICKNVYIEPSPYAYKNSGNGNYQNEILRLRNCYTEEFKGVWYTFTALTSGSFSFLLSAEKPDNEDYDWIMFDLTDVPCSVLATNPAPYMVSSNNFGDWANNKYTGADTDSVKSPPSGNCNGPGTFNGPNFNDDIMVTQGHTYVLYVSNWMDSDNGYVIDFSQSTAKIFDDKAPELKAMESLGSCADAKELKFSFSENVRCEDITPSKFVVTGPSGVVPIASATSNACKVGAPHDKVFTLGFASVLPEGNYTLSLAAEISDICGNKTASSSISFVVKYLKLDDVEVNPLKCMGVMDGSLLVLASGGKQPYAYTINDFGSRFTTNLFSNLDANTYKVGVEDANGCKKTVDVVLSRNPVIVIDDLNLVSPPCFGDANASIRFLTQGGIAPLHFSIDGGATFATDAYFGNLRAGTYSLVVKDDYACSVTQSLTIEQPDLFGGALSYFDILCFGETNGKANWQLEGGTPPYNVNWTFAGSTTVANPDALGKGDYVVKAEDAHHCTAQASFTIKEPELLRANASSYDVRCYGNADGRLVVAPSGGVSPYDIQWYAVGGIKVANPGAVDYGSYALVLKDANNCTQYQNATITQPQLLKADFLTVDPICYGAKTGVITATVTGGILPYSFSVDSGRTYRTTNPIDKLVAYNYEVFVRDANGCKTERKDITLSQPPLIVPTAIIKDVNCFGEASGAVSASAVGGVGLLTLELFDASGVLISDLNTLKAGVFTLKASDFNSCVVIKSIEVRQPEALSIVTTVVDNLCFGDNGGAISTDVMGGSAPLVLLISNSVNEVVSTSTGLASGVYNLKLTDSHNCSLGKQVEVLSPPKLEASFTAMQVTCNGGNNGSAELSVSGGFGTYDIIWPNGTTGLKAEHLSAGVYQVSIKDEHNCKLDYPVEVLQPTVITLELTGNNITCFGANDGRIEVKASGGGGAVNYKYTWETQSGLPFTDITRLSPDFYKLTIVDESVKQCAVDSVEITQPRLLELFVEQTQVSCNNFPDAQLEFSVEGGTAPYQYSWTDPKNLGFVDILNVWPGKYQLSVTDANLCNILQDFEILSKPCPPVIIIPNIFSPNGDGRNDYFEFTAERVASFNATILNRWGEEIYTWHKGMEAWNGESGLGSKAPEGSYFYLIYIVGEDGSSAMFKGPLLLTRISN